MAKKSKVELILEAILQLTLMIAFGLAIYEKNYLAGFICVLTFLLILLPDMLEKRYKINLPTEFEMAIVIFIYAALFLGEIRGFYMKFWWWDYLLHSFSGIAMGFAGFLILYTFYKTEKFKASPFIIALFAFCFALAIGTLWEIFEFSMDQIFKLNMQRAIKTGVVDTMRDLILDSIGALLASTWGYFYLKRKEKFYFRKLIKKFEKTNKELFKS